MLLSTVFFLTVTTVTRVILSVSFLHQLCASEKKKKKPSKILEGSQIKTLESSLFFFSLHKAQVFVFLSLNRKLTLLLTGVFFFFLKDQKDRVYSTVKSRSTSATVNHLKPSTAYVFQVRAFTSAGYGMYGPRLEVTTKDESSGAGTEYCYHWKICTDMM